MASLFTGVAVSKTTPRWADQILPLTSASEWVLGSSVASSILSLSPRVCHAFSSVLQPFTLSLHDVEFLFSLSLCFLSLLSVMGVSCAVAFPVSSLTFCACFFSVVRYVALVHSFVFHCERLEVSFIILYSSIFPVGPDEFSFSSFVRFCVSSWLFSAVFLLLCTETFYSHLFAFISSSLSFHLCWLLFRILSYFSLNAPVFFFFFFTKPRQISS